MDGVIFAARLFVNLLFLLLVQADSIIFSSSHINYHYTHSESYIYTAAKLDNPDANYQLFLQTKDNTWLKKAASLNHVESVYQWYVVQKNNADNNQYVWLQQAVNLGHQQAVLIKLNDLVTKKEWQLASEFQQLHQTLLNRLDEELAKDYQNLKSLLAMIPDQFEQNLTLDNSNLYPNKEQLPFNFNAEGKTEPALKCAITIQSLVASQELIKKAKQFEIALASSPLNDLSICFLPPKVSIELQVICQPDKYSRIECDLNQLAQTLLDKSEVDPVNYNHLMVIVEEGVANTRGGLMYLDQQDSDLVFIHELAHWLGYVDEYQLKAKQQQQLCSVIKAKWISPNLFVTPNTMNKRQAEAQAGRNLYLTSTCEGSNFNAYKAFADPSFMEFLDLPMSQQYADYMKHNVDYSKILPLAMNFWVFYSSSRDLSIDKIENEFLDSSYLTWINVAAAQKYAPAMTILAQHYIELNANTEAYTLLLEAAEIGNVNAQLLLGHGYLEGSWLPQDIIKSAFWYKQAAQQNDPYGLYFFAKCYEMGWGCELSLEKAIGYYQQAKSLGSHLAIKRLNTLSPTF